MCRTSDFATTNKLPVKSSWHPWSLNKQVAGYATEYTTANKDTSFSFVTVKGAGHSALARRGGRVRGRLDKSTNAFGVWIAVVPQYQPPAALEMVTRFLNGTPF